MFYHIFICYTVVIIAVIVAAARRESDASRLRRARSAIIISVLFN